MAIKTVSTLFGVLRLVAAFIGIDLSMPNLARDSRSQEKLLTKSQHSKKSR